MFSQQLYMERERPHVVPDLMEKEDSMKYCFIDVETGGLDPGDCALLQISGMIDVFEGSIHKKDSFNFHIKPFDADEVDPKALAVNNLTLEQIKQFENPRTVHHKLCSVLRKYVDPYSPKDKFFFIGYNSHAFDMPFVRQFFTKCKDKYFGSFFWYPSIDVMLLAIHYLKLKRPYMKDFKLMTVAKRLGIKVEKEKLHDAMYDIELTREIYRTMNLPWEN